ncbi:syntaxin-12-like [Ornithodoros turicata]|uniref:syntaxin-12-like n=1 Tax=Ornithodoros turicata TaxID=34597 RepID=UPI0031389F68
MASSSEGQFRSLSRAIGDNIQKISGNVASMRHRWSFAPGISLQSNLLADTSALAKETTSMLKSLSLLRGADERQQRLLREKLTNDFSNVLHDFRSFQREQIESESARKIPRMSLNPFAEEPETLIELNPFASQRLDHGLQSLTDQDDDLELLRERERSIRQLESDIVDVNTIFNELSSMVHEQGEMIDSIEANVENTSLSVEHGMQQLAMASRHQQKARRKKFCFSIFCIVLVAIIIALIALSFKKR